MVAETRVSWTLLLLITLGCRWAWCVLFGVFSHFCFTVFHRLTVEHEFILMLFMCVHILKLCQDLVIQ